MSETAKATDWVEKVILSCKTEIQFKIANDLIHIHYKKFKHEIFRPYLCGVLRTHKNHVLYP